MKDLKGKVAVITGAASGIGLALATRCAAEGMRLSLADIEEAALARAAEPLTASGAEVLIRATDVSKADQVEALAAATYERFGAAHLVCNNAGVGAGGLSWEVSLAEWEWVIGVNLRGVIHGVRAFVPRMLAGGDEGHLVNTASIAGLLSVPAMSPYNVTKHGVVTLSEALHHELAMVSGGRLGASVLCPGWVQTRIHESHRNVPAQAAAALQASSEKPLAQQMGATIGRLVNKGLAPSEVAGAVLAAVQERRFYILTHPQMTPEVGKRLEAILAGTDPPISMPA